MKHIFILLIVIIAMTGTSCQKEELPEKWVTQEVGDGVTAVTPNFTDYSKNLATVVVENSALQEVQFVNDNGQVLATAHFHGKIILVFVGNSFYEKGASSPYITLEGDPVKIQEIKAFLKTNLDEFME